MAVDFILDLLIVLKLVGGEVVALQVFVHVQLIQFVLLLRLLAWKFLLLVDLYWITKLVRDLFLEFQIFLVIDNVHLLTGLLV